MSAASPLPSKWRDFLSPTPCAPGPWRPFLRPAVARWSARPAEKWIGRSSPKGEGNMLESSPKRIEFCCTCCNGVFQQEFEGLPALRNVRKRTSTLALLTHESACSEILARSCSLFTRVGQPRKAHIARHDEPTTGFASLEIQQFDSIMLYHHLGQSSLALRSKQASNPNVCQLSQLRYFCHLVPVVSGVGSAKLSIQHPKAVAFAWLGALLCQGWKLKGMVQKVWVCLKIGYPWLPQNPNGHHFPY